MFQSSFFKNNIDSLIAAAAGFFIIFLFTRHGGIGIEPDSVVYTTTAENFHNSGKLTDFTGSPLVIFPSFYPLFLSCIILLTGLKPLAFAPYLNAILFALIIYLSGYVMESFSFRSKWYKRAVLICIVFSPALLEVYSMVWSETVFILLLLLFLIAIKKYFQSYSRKALSMAATLASIASITRYAGISVILAGILFLVLDMKMPVKQKIKHIVLFGLISPLLLIINLVRNFLANGTETGLREKSLVSFYKDLHDAGFVFNDWLHIPNSYSNGAAYTMIIIILFLSYLCIKYFLRYKRITSYESMAAVFSLVYILFMIIIAGISRFEELNSRFFSPVFILLIWSCSNWIVSSTGKISFLNKRLITVLNICIFLGFMYGQLSADYETWDGVKDAGIPGYTEDQWKFSQTVNFIEKSPFLFRNGYSVYSDATDAVYFFTHRLGKFLPHKEDKNGLQSFLADRHCYVVWFNDGEDSDLVGIDFITKVKKMKLLKQFDDGAIYEYDK